MFRLRGYLKPYWLFLILALVFLLGQGISELYLPEMMSDIVNNGIQRSGIRHSAPEAISSQGLEFVELFLSKDDAAAVSAAFRQAETAEMSELKNKYTAASPEQLFIMKDNADREKLDELFNRSSYAMILTLSSMIPEEQKNNGIAVNSDEADISKLYLVKKMPGLKAMAQPYIAQAANADPTVTSGTGAAMAKLYLQELGVNTNEMRNDYIFRIGFNMIVLTLLGAAASIIVSLFASFISAGAARKLRSDVFRKVESFSNTEFDRFTSSSLITRTTNDITQLQNIVNMGIRMICYAPILGIGGAVLAARTTTSMGWIIISAIVLLLAVMLIVFVIAMPKFRIIQKLIDRLNLVARESLNGVLVIRAFSAEKYEEQRFDKANTELTSVNLFVNRVMTFLLPVMMFVMNGVSMLVVWIGAHQIEQSQMQVGDMMAFIQYSMMIILSFLMIAVIFIIIPRASVSGARIAEVLECSQSINDPSDPMDPAKPARGDICFDNVSFRYDGADSDVLSNISFTAGHGETVAFIGTTGSGKTTLLNLIPRFYDVTEGKITIDGVDIRRLRQHDLRKMIGYVPQKSTLFSGDIASNLRYGSPDADDELIERAAKTAQALEFIDEKPERFGSRIAQGGTNVSGGQKQRLSIARALARRARIYLFDDSFSALDFRTDAALRKGLREFTGDSTVLIVAQRVSSIMNADRILVLDNGRIVGQGTHNELLKSCDTYREIAVSQNSAMEI